MPILNTEQRAEIVRRYRAGESGAHLAQAFGVSNTPVYNHLRRTGVLTMKRRNGIPVPPEQRRCSLCKEIKPFDTFVNCATRPESWGKTYECRECATRRHHALGRGLKYNTGLTLEEYERILKTQGGCCAICRRPPTRARFAVDHDHKTHAIRGLLCTRCNQLLGGIENEDWFEAAISYLRYASTGLKWRGKAPAA